MKSQVQTTCVPRVVCALLTLILVFAANLSVAETPIVNETQKIWPSDGELFNQAVALDGDTALIGSQNPSSVYVFRRGANGSWSEEATLEIDGASRASFFDLDGDTALIGYRIDASPVGKAYVYTRDANDVWTDQAILPMSGVNEFGAPVALDGDTALIGGNWGDDQLAAVWVFTRGANGEWTEQTKLLGYSPGEELISRIDLDGDTALIQRIARYVGSRVSVFTQDANGVWSYQAALGACSRSPNSAAGDISLDGNTALCAVDDGPGAVHAFTRDADGKWSEQAKLVASNGEYRDQFGRVIALDGNAALISAPAHSGNGPPGGGTAYVFSRGTGGLWTEKAQLLPSDSSACTSQFGSQLALDGALALINSNCSVGPVYVFELEEFIGRFEIGIDIKPGNRRNVINPGSKGRFWAAVVSDKVFDALQVDPATVALGSAEASPDRYRVRDVNRDRLPDLMLRFRTPEVGLQCGDTEVVLTGETYAGDSIIGTDAVKTVGCKKKPKKGKKK